MELDQRLAALAAMTPKGARLADIGTDHAYLPSWLVQQGRIDGAIASDVLPGPCRAAEKTIAAAGLSDKISVRCGDGLATIRLGEVDTIVIAGMGGTTIIAILERGADVLAQTEHLLLQPMGGVATVRRWLYEHGWFLDAETIAVERGRWYEILSARRGEKACPNEALLWLGPVLTEMKHPLLAAHADQVVERLETTLAAMQNGKNTAEKQKRYRQLLDEIAEVRRSW